MNNYEYIIASLPIPDKAAALDVDGLLEEIRSQLDSADNALLSLLLDGFNSDRLDRDFYVAALGSSNGFIRGYFMTDLQVRNTKTEYLNRKLGRPEGLDVIDLPDSLDFDGRPEVEAVLAGTDILEREKGLDSIMWDTSERLTLMHLFDLDIILSFVARMMITDRWNRLDAETGREMFRSLVQEIRNTR